MFKTVIVRFLLPLLCAFFMVASSCKQSPSRQSSDANLTNLELKPVVGGLNDQARLYAGLSLSDEYANRPEVGAILKKPAYQSHVKMMDAFWASVQKERIDRIRPWREEYLGSKVTNRTALYPLSGGDILNFTLMYPQAERYIMIAMEKRGEVVDPATLTDAQLSGSLRSVQQMLGNIARTGYFFSRLMNEYMNPEQYGTFGTLPTVSIFLVRLGHTLLSVEKTCVNDNGELYSSTAQPCRLPGYRLRFRDSDTGRHKEVIYISTKLTDKQFDINTAEGKFFQNIGRTSVMLKAAVYLLHSPNYRNTAQYLLDNTDVVVQDDSGLPYRYFEPAKWSVDVYGAFAGPPAMSGIQYYPQPDLVKAFQVAGPLPFEFGYGQVSASKKSGIIVAYRK